MLLLLIDSLKLIFATVTTSTSISIHNLRFQLKISKSEKVFLIYKYNQFETYSLEKAYQKTVY